MSEVMLTKEQEDMAFHLRIIEGHTFCAEDVEVHKTNPLVARILGDIPAEVIVERGFAIGKEANKKVGYDIY